MIDREAERDFYTVKECCRLNSISRATLYRLLKAGALSAVRVGTRTLITAKSMQEWQARLPAYPTNAPTNPHEIGSSGQRRRETNKSRKLSVVSNG